jgi:hypothetical protein
MSASIRHVPIVARPARATGGLASDHEDSRHLSAAEIYLGFADKPGANKTRYQMP